MSCLFNGCVGHLYAFATPQAQEIFNKVAEHCAPPVKKLNYEDIKLSLEYESNANYVFSCKAPSACFI